MTDFQTRLTNWLQQQPEYPTLFLAGRARRRAAARSLAKQVLILPTLANEGANRQTRRAAVKAYSKAVGQANAKLSKRQQRLLREQEKQRRRYARLSEARTEQVLQEEFARALEAQALGAD